MKFEFTTRATRQMGALQPLETAGENFTRAVSGGEGKASGKGVLPWHGICYRGANGRDAMSDSVKHECAVALLRLKKDAEYYRAKYGMGDWGGAKLSLLLEKQHNRGQDGAGAAILSLAPQPGRSAYTVLKSASATPLADLLGKIARRTPLPEETLFLGHLRYATFGRHEETFCHPFVHKSSCLERTLMLAGNFNLTNNAEIFERYVAAGHFPESRADGFLLAQTIAHHLGKCCDGQKPYCLENVLRTALEGVDGAYTLCGMTAAGEAFAIRDPHGIRPGYYYENDEVAVVASERPAIQAAFDCPTCEVKELPRGEAYIVMPHGVTRFAPCLAPQEERGCVFERIYFSRANDAAIHRERKALGAALVAPVLEAAGDVEHTFFSYIPNSAQVAFHGLIEAAMPLCKRLRFGQVAVKDAKFRTFIADAAARREFYKHVYDITYGLVEPGVDTLVVLDDSIVRGNTMKNAILPMLERLGPKKIIVASSAPPICYPDCYGIDMSTLGELVAFRALVNLLGDGAEEELRRAAASAEPNPLRPLYARFGAARLAGEIARLLTPQGMNAQVEVVFQSLEGLHAACPDAKGDWYFTGDYPTPGGYKVLHNAIANYLARSQQRSY
ncbi:MAG: amidophosphoribosyltransferase [Kiritimatiellae bacterium]|nr:amidophosphoribosyltransferase [Kiritimatiellia bacterium]